MHHVTVVKLEKQPNRDQRGSGTISDTETRLCIERLQGEIARLLLKNQTIRFELSAAQQTIARIEYVLFGAGTAHLDKLLPPDRVRHLRDLCEDGQRDIQSNSQG
jgi:hypothetical protein